MIPQNYEPRPEEIDGAYAERRYWEVLDPLVGAATKMAGNGDTCGLRRCLMDFAEEIATRGYAIPVFLERARSLAETANTHGKETATFLINIPVFTKELETQLNKTPSLSS